MPSRRGTGPRRAGDVLILAVTIWGAWQMLPPQRRSDIRAGSLARLSTELGHLAVRAGRLGLVAELDGLPGSSVLYGAATRTRLVADLVMGMAKNAYR
jgi:hypothetical protein